MKKLLFIAGVAALSACTSPAPQEKKEAATPVERAIGFSTLLPDEKWHLATEEAIQIVKDLDKVWAAQDYDALKPFFADTCVFYFPDGKVLESPEAFIENMKEFDSVTEHSWTFDYAFSVDLDPTRGGEHVQAGFTGTEVKDNVETKKYFHESYYVVDGKIVMWRQYTMDIKGE